MPRLAIAVALAAVIGGAGPARADDAAAIRQTLADWTAAFNAGNADAACRIFAPDLIVRYRGQPVRGKAEICDQIARSLSDPRQRLAYAAEIEEVIVSGDLAVVRRVWTLRVEREGRTIVSREPGLDVFRRGADGAWRIIRYLAYSEDKDE